MDGWVAAICGAGREHGVGPRSGRALDYPQPWRVSHDIACGPRGCTSAISNHRAACVLVHCPSMHPRAPEDIGWGRLVALFNSWALSPLEALRTEDGCSSFPPPIGDHETSTKSRTPLRIADGPEIARARIRPGQLRRTELAAKKTWRRRGESGERRAGASVTKTAIRVQVPLSMPTA